MFLFSGFRALQFTGLFGFEGSAKKASLTSFLTEFLVSCFAYRLTYRETLEKIYKKYIHILFFYPVKMMIDAKVLAQSLLVLAKDSI